MTKERDRQVREQHERAAARADHMGALFGATGRTTQGDLHARVPFKTLEDAIAFRDDVWMKNCVDDARTMYVNRRLAIEQRTAVGKDDWSVIPKESRKFEGGERPEDDDD